MTSEYLQARIPVIHIGMPKTATKTLQWRLFSQHEEIYYFGRFDGISFREYRKLDHCRNQTVQALMRRIAYGNVSHPNFDECRSLYVEALQPALVRNLVPVWSWESYSTDTLEMRQLRARNLKQVFGDAKILMTIRHPLTLLESAFLQTVKSKNVGRRRKYGAPPYCPDIHEWLEKEWERDVRHHLQYADTIEAYMDQFGHHRIHLLVFEQLKDDSEAFWGRICDILGVSKEQGLCLVGGARDNSAWTQNELERLRAIRKSPLQSLLFRISKSRHRQNWLGLARGGGVKIQGPKARLDISPEWRSRILAETRDRNHWLSETFKLPLTEYHYMRDR